MKLKPKITLPADMDVECIELCNALNMLPGVRTTESCQGHGRHQMWIFFKVAKLRDLIPVCYFTRACHSGLSGWSVEAWTDCSMNYLCFILNGPINTTKETADKLATFVSRYARTGRTR